MCYVTSVQPVCHDVVAAKVETENSTKLVCSLSQAELAQWKEKSPFKGSEWYIGQYSCISNNAT